MIFYFFLYFKQFNDCYPAQHAYPGDIPRTSRGCPEDILASKDVFGTSSGRLLDVHAVWDNIPKMERTF